MRTALFLGFGLALTACSTTDGEGQWTIAEGVGPIDKQPVIYGGDAPDEPYHDAVVALHYRSGTTVYRSPFCTGTLIDTDVVLTAAHCLDAASGGSTYREMSASNLAIYVGDDPASDLASHVYTVSDLEINTSYNRSSLRNDIALVRLSGDITESVDPVPPLPSSLGLTSGDAGEILNFAGFGYTETGDYGEKLQVDVEMAGLGCAVSGCTGASTSTQFSYSQSGYVGPCSGDSGGPAFIDRSGTTYVAGITSYGDYYCRVYGVSTRVDAYESFWGDWIDADTGGGGGDGGASEPYCGDGTCDDDESCDGRMGTESCSSDCDGVTSGPRFRQYCFVGDTCYGRGCARL